jgi:hypothetical protein
MTILWVIRNAPIKFQGVSIEPLSIFRACSNSNKNQLRRVLRCFSDTRAAKKHIPYPHSVYHIAINFHLNGDSSRVNASQGPSPSRDMGQLIFWKASNSGIKNRLLTELRQWEIVADLRCDRTDALTALWPYLVTVVYSASLPRRGRINALRLYRLIVSRLTESSSR